MAPRYFNERSSCHDGQEPCLSPNQLLSPLDNNRQAISPAPAPLDNKAKKKTSTLQQAQDGAPLNKSPINGLTPHPQTLVT